MPKPKSIIWQQTTLLVIAVAASSFLVSRIGLLNQTAKQKNSDTALTAPPKNGVSKVTSQLEQQAKAQLLNFSIPRRFQGKILEDVKLGNKEKAIALTFDDGPTPPYTQKILKILKQNNVKGTFFVVGQNLKNYPQLGQQIVAEGHSIANHTWSHSYRHFSPSGAAREIEDTEALIYKTTGVKTSIFRPPGGFLHNGVVDYAKKQKYFIALWSADSSDWRRPSVPKLVNNVLNEAHPGGMALMHDGGGPRSHTVQALPKIIAELRKRGYKFVTVPELLDMEDKELQFKEAAKLNSIKTANAALPKPQQAKK